MVTVASNRAGRSSDSTAGRLEAREGALKRVASLLEYVFMLVVIVECNSMFESARQTDYPTKMTDVLYWMTLALLVALVALHVARDRGALRKLARFAPVWLAVAVWIVAFYLLNVRVQNAAGIRQYRKLFFLFLPVMMLLFRLKQQRGEGLELLYAHADIMFVIAAMSLVVYLASVFHANDMPSDVFYSAWSDDGRLRERINILNICQFANAARWAIRGISLLRNNGFFTEPLMFAMPMICALYTELFLRGQTDRWRYFRAAVLSATLISANATIALMLMAAAWGMKAAAESIRSGKKLLLLLVCLGMAAACLLLLVEKNKLGDALTAVSGNSVADHIEDYRASIKAFLNRPILGGGYNRIAYIREFMNADKQARNPGLSNTAGLILAQGGIVFGLLCMLPFGIGLAHAFKRGSRGVALWFVGALGLYVGIIFTAQSFLPLLLAFGYSLVEVRRDEGGRRRWRVALVGAVPEDDAPPIAGRTRGRTFAIAGAIALAVAALVAFGSPVFRALHSFLRLHGFSIGQSPLKAFLLDAALLFNGWCLAEAIRGRLAWRRFALLLAWDAAVLLAWPRLYSDGLTLLTALGHGDEVYIAALMSAGYIAGSALALCLRPKRWLKPARAVAAGVAVAAAVAVFCLGQMKIGRMATASAELAPALEALTDSASGAVYFVDQPSVAHRLNPKVSLCPTTATGFDVLDGATVVYRAGTDRPELLERGFEVAQMGEDYLIYSNDEAVLSTLGERGMSFYRYYPYPREVDLKALARRNKLKRKDGLIIGGGGNSLTKGPADTLQKGQYTVSYDLAIDPEDYAGCAGDTVVCTLSASGFSGKETVAQSEVTLARFDADGHLTMDLPFKLDAITTGVEYKALGQEERAVRLKSLTVRQTPDYVTLTTYNCRRDAIREEYYSTRGTPYVMYSGYTALERDYNSGNQVLAARYYGADGQPVMTAWGCAETRYTYNEKGAMTSETYYDAKGNLVNAREGYAMFRAEYDGSGNQTRVRYYGTDGALTLSTKGYAELRRTFNDQRQLVSESYFDVDGSPRLQTSGYSGYEQEYDEDGNVSCRRFFHEGAPVLRTDGYAEVRWQYNGMRQIVREAFFDAADEPVKVFEGYAADEREYDADGDVIAYRYYDELGRPTLIANGYAEVRRAYNDRRMVSRETYYGSDGQPILLSGGYAAWERTYTAQGGVQSQRYFGVSGEPVLMKDGYFEVRRSFDGAGQPVEESYCDTQGNPVACAAGYASVRRDYDGDGLLVEETFYDVQGAPASIDPGYTRITYEYTGDRQLALTHYLDGDGNGVQAGSGYFHEYLRSLMGRDVTVFIAVADEATSSLTATLFDDFRELGLQTDLRGRYRNSYYAVIAPDGVAEEITPQGTVSHEGMVGNTPYTIVSAGFQVGNYSSIVIGGVEYSKNGRGFNIVVYDNGSGQVIDSVVFDTYVQAMTVRR